MNEINIRLERMYLRISCNRLIIIILFSFIMMLTGCATAPKVNSGDDMALADPYENINRLSYDFTDSIDRIFLEPVVNVYTEYVPDAAQRSVGNFYDNLSYPGVVLNAFLQGKIRQGFEDGLRFIVNSTIGLFGLFDMATHMGLAENDEDFGQTLGVWGVDAGSYLFIPMLGPNNERDVSDIPVSIATNVLFYAGYMVGVTVLAPLTVLGAIDKRARLSGPMRIRDQAALDPYLFVREASMQQREYLIHDGSPPLEIYNELFQDNLLQSNFIDEVSD